MSEEKSKWTAAELELIDTLKAYESQITSLYKRLREEKSEYMAIIGELEERIEELEKQLEETA